MSLYDLNITDWQELLREQPPFRAVQIWQAIHRRGIRPEELTSLPKGLRESLSNNLQLASALKLIKTRSDKERMTHKALFALGDGRVIETVLMHYSDRSTVCVSSQAGCAMNCSFCATGQQGFFRHLTVGEIVEQVIWAINSTAATRGQKRLSNIVFMGMGEPLSNTRNVFEALSRINDDIGIGARHITVSTVGIVPGIKAFTALGTQFNLAVSLHAANNEKRTSLVPINARYPIDALMQALNDYVSVSHRRVSFEWAMIDGVNDTDGDARELIELCQAIDAHVNLIPLNPTPLSPAKGSPISRVHSFANVLHEAGVAVSVRDNRGTDISAACGQLAGMFDAPNSVERFRKDGPSTIDIGALLN